jgi:O-antigen/teichoic acid export membrane protein
MSSIRRNMLWMAASQSSVFAIQFASTMVIARLLTPYEMGVFAAAMAVVGLLAVVRNMGLGTYVIRAAALSEPLLRTTFTINGLLALLIGGAVALLSVAGEALLDEPGVRWVLMVIALVPVVSILEFRPATVLERHGRFRAIAAVNLVRAMTSATLTITLALDGHSYMSLAYGQLLGGVVGVVLFNLVGWRHAGLRLGFDGWREVLRYGGHMLAVGGLNAASVRISDLLLARMLGLGALGIYSRATGVATMIWDNLNLVVGRAFFVDLADQRRQGRALRDRYLLAMEMITALLWPLFVGLAVLSGPVVVVLYGGQWVEAQLPLSLLALAAVPHATIVMSGSVLMVTERTADQARLETIRSVVGLGMFLVGCMFGLAGAATARILESILAVLLFRRLVQRMSETRERDYTPIYLRSLALTAVAVAPAAVTMGWYGWSAQAPLGPLAAATLAGIVLWAAMLRQMAHPLYEQGRWILARLGLWPLAGQRP